MRTLEQQLKDVQRAIEKIETGAQEYEFEVSPGDGGSAKRKVRRADLKMLYKREAFLKREIERQTALPFFQVRL